MSLKFTSNTGHIAGHGDRQCQLSSRAGRSALCRDQSDLSASSAGVGCLIQIASERTSAVGIALIDCNLHTASLGHLGNITNSQCVFGVLANIDVTSRQCSATLVDHIGSELGDGDEVGIIGIRGINYEFGVGVSIIIFLLINQPTNQPDDISLTYLEVPDWFPSHRQR